MKVEQIDFNNNNLDKIRHFAAIQVALFHISEYLYPSISKIFLVELLRIFPGVPIFFFISGFLISRSFEKSTSIQAFFLNRIIRIYPGLHVCLIFNIVAIWVTDYFAYANVGIKDIFILFFAKATFFQFYNPQFMRNFGDGVLNGSLWTICVELQFYILTPITYKIFIKKNKYPNIYLFVIIAISIIFNSCLYNLNPDYYGSIFWKFARVSFMPWIYMFLIGVIFQRNFKVIYPFIAKIPIWFCFVCYIIFGLYFKLRNYSFGNDIQFYIFIPLILLIFRVAYSKLNVSFSITKGNDLSYGIYIYHMVIVNLMLHYGYKGRIWYVAIAVFLSILMGAVSWKFIESPILIKKKYSIRSEIIRK